MDKKKLGQFYTTNYDYILQNLNIPNKTKTIIEPFAGNGDLLSFLKKKYKIECYDIDSKKEFIIQKDTLLNPPEFNNKFVLTNPPYLARNKNSDKTIYDKYKQNDLYKCFISILINNKCDGGILIIPLNFWCSIRKNDIELRQRFLNIYSVLIMNIFEEKVFEDTSYTICSFQFEKKIKEKTIECYIYPSKNKINFNLNELNNYTLGGEIYNLKQDINIKIERLTKKNKSSEYKTSILLKCIDDNIKNKIRLEISEKDYIDETENLSLRSYATLVINPKLNLEEQIELVKKFNNFLEKERTKYNSLFLSNYRDSNTIARKRISFSLAFEIINYLLNH
jgi:hypothetical protein